MNNVFKEVKSDLKTFLLEHHLGCNQFCQSIEICVRRLVSLQELLIDDNKKGATSAFFS